MRDVKRICPGIARAALAIAYDNGGINRDRSEEDCLNELGEYLDEHWLRADHAGLRTILIANLVSIDRWLNGLSEVTGVKIEWLQDITIEDALAEGALEATDIPYVGAMTCDQARVAFSLLWDKLHGKTGPDSWEANPEVVCISFRRIEAPHG